MSRVLLTSICFFIICMNYSIAGTITLPQTGQNVCYDELGNIINCTGTGQDGDFNAGIGWPNPRFSVNRDCVLDNLTGLMWAKNANIPNQTLSWQDGLDYIKSLNTAVGLCGYTDWRMPNSLELGSLVNLGVKEIQNWLRDQGFTNIQHMYISSSTDSQFKYYVRHVEFHHGSAGEYDKEKSYGYLWPVRGESLGVAPMWRTGQDICFDTDGIQINCSGTGQDGDLKAGVEWPSPRFTDNGDGTATDNMTGLIWLKNVIDKDSDNNSMRGPAVCHPEIDKTWEEAFDYVKCLNSNNYLGYNDWQVPNRVQLQSLIDYQRENPSLPEGHPFRYPSCGRGFHGASYWTSTTVASQPDKAWWISMSHGLVTEGSSWNSTKESRMPVWPIRCVASIVSRYRLYNPNDGNHHYCTSQNEYNTLYDYGWIQEGIACYMYDGLTTIDSVNAVPYYRLYNPNSGEHHYTTDANEYTVLETIGWIQEDIDGYVFASQVTGSEPLYRLYNPNDGLHLWTMDINERDVLIDLGWVDEGIACYVFSE